MPNLYNCTSESVINCYEDLCGFVVVVVVFLILCLTRVTQLRSAAEVKNSADIISLKS